MSKEILYPQIQGVTGTIRHRLAEVAEGVRHAFHLAAVLLHREAPLGELVELSIEV
jgi:hypothetical protein